MTQTIQFAAYGLPLDMADKGEYADGIAQKVDSAVTIIPWIGISVSFLIFLGIIAAVGALWALKEKHKDLDVKRWTTLLGQGTGLFLPLFLLLAGST